MIQSIVRSIAAVTVSLVVALLLLIAIEWASAILHPFPADFGGSGQEMVEHVANYPVWVLALLGVGGWGLTMLVSSWLATRLGTGRHPAHGLVLGLILLAAAIFNISMLPYPLWFVVLDLVVLPAAGYYGTRLGRADTGSIKI